MDNEKKLRLHSPGAGEGGESQREFRRKQHTREWESLKVGQNMWRQKRSLGPGLQWLFLRQGLLGYSGLILISAPALLPIGCRRVFPSDCV